MTEFWTEEAVATLKSMYRGGATGSQIARRLGCSRNAVLGKVHRLGLMNRNGASPLSAAGPRRRGGQQVPRPAPKFKTAATRMDGSAGADFTRCRAKPKEDRPGASKTGSSRDLGSRLAGGRTPAATSERMDVTSRGGENPAPIAAHGRPPVPLLELDPQGCRFAVSPHGTTTHLFCGAPRRPGSSYCAVHHRLAHDSGEYRTGTYTDAENDLIRRMWLDGHNAETIAAELGRRPSSVHRQATFQLGLPRRKREAA